MLQQTYKNTDSSGGKQADMQQDTLAVSGSTSMTAAATALDLQLDSLSPVSEGFVGDPWLSIQYNTIHYGKTSLGNLRVALACEPRWLIPYSLVSYPSYPLGD
jgi:hypothetical protein